VAQSLTRVTLLALVSNVAFQSVQLHLQLSELSLGPRALTLVDGNDDHDESDQCASTRSRHNDHQPRVIRVRLQPVQLLVLQLTQTEHQVANAHLNVGQTCIYVHWQPVALT